MRSPQTLYYDVICSNRPVEYTIHLLHNKFAIHHPINHPQSLTQSCILMSCRKTTFSMLIYVSLMSYLLALTSCFKEEDLKANWEERPEGILCTPTPSPDTWQNGELTFELNHMLCIHVEMDASNFDIMRNESRFGPSIQQQNGRAVKRAAADYIGQCDVPFPSLFKRYKANVQIDGAQALEVGIRKKGFLGSVFSRAPSIKIAPHLHQPNPLFQSIQELVLNNNSEDPSRLIQPIHYAIFRWANYPAPRCNLANVAVNGEALGVYTHIEPINEAFLRRNFGNANGDLYECTLTDFQLNWISRWEAKTNATDQSNRRIADLARVLQNSSDQDLLTDLEKHLNLERFIRYWALEIILQHHDGYSMGFNNLYVYFDPNDQHRATFIPYGMNEFNSDPHKTLAPLNDFANSELPRRLSHQPTIIAMLEQEVQQLLNTVWNPSTILAMVDQLEQQIHSAEVGLSSDQPDFRQLYRDWVLQHKAALTQQWLDEGPPQGESEPSLTCHP